MLALNTGGAEGKLEYILVAIQLAGEQRMRNDVRNLYESRANDPLKLDLEAHLSGATLRRG